MSYIGPAGSKGAIGFIGNTGLKGITGLTGFRGKVGIKGLLGNTGITGPTGLTGLMGFTGSQGITGLIGDTGIQGLIGSTGIIGPTGIIGLTGPSNGLKIIGNTVLWQLPEYIDNATAKDNGIPIYGLYRNNDILKIRLNDIPPILYLNGTSNISIFENEIIQDPGVYALDFANTNIPVYLYQLIDENNINYITNQILINSTNNTIINPTSNLLPKNYTLSYCSTDDFDITGYINRTLIVKPFYQEYVGPYTMINGQINPLTRLNIFNKADGPSFPEAVLITPGKYITPANTYKFTFACNIIFNALPSSYNFHLYDIYILEGGYVSLQLWTDNNGYMTIRCDDNMYITSLDSSNRSLTMSLGTKYYILQTYDKATTTLNIVIAENTISNIVWHYTKNNLSDFLARPSVTSYNGTFSSVGLGGRCSLNGTYPHAMAATTFTGILSNARFSNTILTQQQAWS